MSEQHTPWRLKLLPSSETTIYTDDEHEMFVASCGTGEKQRNRETKANARRLVACWNALDGISTSQIEAAARSGSIAYALHKVISQRDELLEALDGLLGPNTLRSLCRQDGRDALGRVRGTWGEEAEENARAAYNKHRQPVITKMEGSGV